VRPRQILAETLDAPLILDSSGPETNQPGG
jgi:hypothetical protein